MAVVTQWVILIPDLQGLLLQMGSWAPACLQHILGACLKTAFVSVLPGRLYEKETTNAYCQNLTYE